MRILVTGGPGFIGPHLTDHLLGTRRRGCRSGQLRRVLRPGHQRRNLRQAVQHEAFRLIEGDLRHGDALRSVPDRLAAPAGVRPSIDDIFNLGNDRTVKLKDMIDVLAKEMGVEAKIRRCPMQPGDVERTHADISKAGSVLGYDPSVDFSKSLRLFVEWFDAAQLE